MTKWQRKNNYVGAGRGLGGKLNQSSSEADEFGNTDIVKGNALLLQSAVYSLTETTQSASAINQKLLVWLER